MGEALPNLSSCGKLHLVFDFASLWAFLQFIELWEIMYLGSWIFHLNNFCSRLWYSCRCHLKFSSAQGKRLSLYQTIAQLYNLYRTSPSFKDPFHASNTQGKLDITHRDDGVLVVSLLIPEMLWRSYQFKKPASCSTGHLILENQFFT